MRGIKLCTVASLQEGVNLCDRDQLREENRVLQEKVLKLEFALSQAKEHLRKQAERATTYERHLQDLLYGRKNNGVGNHNDNSTFSESYRCNCGRDKGR